MCAAPGICDIETAPHSIEATFTGRNETFQYTKVRHLVSNAYVDTQSSRSILRVRFCMCSHTALTRLWLDSCETLEMHKADPARRHEAQGTSQPQPGQERRPLLRGEVRLLDVLYTLCRLTTH